MYTAIDAMARVQFKITFPELVHSSQHATLKDGRKLYTVPYDEKLYMLPHISTMSGKLYGLLSLTTTCTENPYCIEAMKDINSPCHQCFAAKTAAQYNAMREWAALNYLILTSRFLTESEIRMLCLEMLKSFNRKIRIEFAGDVGNSIQAENYLNIIRIGAEYGLYFGVWSKLLHIWRPVFERCGKPENMTFIYSAPGLNQVDEPQHMQRENWYIDSIFIVCDKSEYQAVENSWTDRGYSVHDCKCEKGSCANDNICGYCFRRDSKRRDDSTTGVNVILEVLRK